MSQEDAKEKAKSVLAAQQVSVCQSQGDSTPGIPTCRLRSPSAVSESEPLGESFAGANGQALALAKAKAKCKNKTQGWRSQFIKTLQTKNWTFTVE